MRKAKNIYIKLMGPLDYLFWMKSYEPLRDLWFKQGIQLLVEVETEEL
jgi:hypothetical protein